MGKYIVIEKGKVVTPFEVIDDGAVLIENERIVGVGPRGIEIPSGAGAIDAKDLIVSPGFIDIHFHGGWGKSVSDGSYEAINLISESVARHGTTSFVPSTGTASKDEILKGVKGIREAIEKGTTGAEVLGIHLEGPYISPVEKGAHLARYIRSASLEELDQAVKASRGSILMMTIAPEVEGALELIKELRRRGIVASVGHSNATYDEAMVGIRAGVRNATHTFNGMRGFHHRDPGLLGAIFTHDEVTAEIIADGVHVHPVAVKMLVKAKGVDKVVLVTDATMAGVPDGVYEMLGQEVTVKNGICRTEAGGLAGSSLTMNVAVRNMVNLMGSSLREAIMMATVNPTKVVGVNDKKGSIEPGKDADIVILDSEFDVQTTIVKGRIVYQRE